MAIITFTAIASSSTEVIRSARYLIVGEDPSTHEQWQIAEHLREIGIVPGDKVAVIGDSFRAFWAHLAGVRIVSEIPARDTGSFWEADSTLKAEVIKTFASTGAKAIVVEPPSGTDLSGWQRIRNTTYYVYLVKP